MTFHHRMILAADLATKMHAAFMEAGRSDLANQLEWAGMEDPDYDYYREQSKELDLDENDFDMDDDPLVSGGDDGAYVAVWHWIPAPPEAVADDEDEP